MSSSLPNEDTFTTQKQYYNALEAKFAAADIMLSRLLSHADKVGFKQEEIEELNDYVKRLRRCGRSSFSLHMSGDNWREENGSHYYFFTKDKIPDPVPTELQNCRVKVRNGTTFFQVNYHTYESVGDILYDETFTFAGLVMKKFIFPIDFFYTKP